MTTKTTRKTTRKDRDEDRATTAAAIAQAEADPDAPAHDFDAETFDPQAEKTAVEDVLGELIVVTAASVRPSSYENDKGETGNYAALRFYLASDRTRQERYLTTGGVRLVPAITAALKAKHALPWRVTIVKSGNVYRFARKGEKVA